MKDGTTGDAGDIYTGLDRFGRLAETLWKTNSTTLIQTKYGRNRVGGVVWQYNVKAHASSAATQDHYYWYDGLQQVTRHDRGNLVPSIGPPYTGIASANRQQQERFTFDETGNWTSENTQNPALAQTRTHNPANQITSISGPSGAVQPAYDPAGNMTVMPSTQDWSVGDELTWDAWNRLTRVRPASSSSSSSSLSSSESSSSSSQSSSSSENSSSSSSESHSSSGSSSSSAPSGEITYQYDARTRRTRKTNTAGSIDYYYDKQWRAIEERVGSSVSAEYVWSPLDRWTMIRRKRGTEVRFVLKDYLDPSAIIDSSAKVIERFGYDAFGSVRFMDDSFAPQAGSAADWNFLFHAEFLDNDSGLYNYGYRYYNPQLGRWLSRDPIKELGGVNLYWFVDNDGLGRFDVLGLHPQDKWYGRNDKNFQRWVHKIKQDQKRRHDFDEEEIENLEKEWLELPKKGSPPPSDCPNEDLEEEPELPVNEFVEYLRELDRQNKGNGAPMQIDDRNKKLIDEILDIIGGKYPKIPSIPIPVDKIPLVPRPSEIVPADPVLPDRKFPTIPPMKLPDLPTMELPFKRFRF
jgi:RHS repeat-associated protein